jgi:hypothetical protein
VVACLGETSAAALASNAISAELRPKLSISAAAGAVIAKLLYLTMLRVSPHWITRPRPRVRVLGLFVLVLPTGLALLNREL